MIKALIDKGTDVNAVDQKAWTPLRFAAQMCHNYIVYAIIEKGAHVIVVRKDNCTPLHLAIENDHTEIEKILIENEEIVDENTLLLFAANNGYTEKVKDLIEQWIILV
ncbi:hypothetical protein NPIL_615781 [Nephila pilipes]|uniref:Uncharacterized protein n=1 Tax=Nephila pilipes TaxID=299642 RepID=A0A8X6UK31_NEPPI|nr:hypothetical protein NPIL_615781 [Nephila pilipes]